MCRKAVFSAALCWLVAAPNGLAKEASPPGSTTPTPIADLKQPPVASSVPADVGRADEPRWLESPRLGAEASASSVVQAPRWAWCVLGVLTVAILGLMSFGWREGHLPEAWPTTAGGDEDTTLHSEASRPGQPSSQGSPGRKRPNRPSRPRAAGPAKPPVHEKLRAIDMPGGVGAEDPRLHFLRTCGSVCVGLCGGGGVWDVAYAD